MKDKGDLKERGAIFTLDVTMAIIIVVIFVVITSFYVSRSNEQTLSDIRTSRVGSDAIALLDNSRAMYFLDSDQLILNLTNTLPPTHASKLDIDCAFQGIEIDIIDIRIAAPQDNFPFGPPYEVPDSGFVASGKRFFIVELDRIDHDSIWVKLATAGLDEGDIINCHAQQWTWVK